VREEGEKCNQNGLAITRYMVMQSVGITNDEIWMNEEYDDDERGWVRNYNYNKL